MSAVRVLVAEDHVLLREGVARLLEEAGFEVVGLACDADEMLALTRQELPDIVVADVQMPPDFTDDGLRAAEQIRRELPGVAILLLTQFLEERYALDLIGEDPSGIGYLLKDRIADVESFTETVRRVAAGGSALDPQVVGRMVSRRRHNDPLDALTAREREVLALMAEGKSNAGIAEALSVSGAAVEKHATNVFRKLGVGQDQAEHRRVMAVLTQLRAS